MDLINGFKNNTESKKISYIVAFYNKRKRKWYAMYQYEEIEKAKEKKEEVESLHVGYKCGIFEYIESEIINQICV